MPLIAEKPGFRTFPVLTQQNALYFAIFIIANIKIIASNKEYGEKCIINTQTNAHTAIIKSIIKKTGKYKIEIFPDGL